MSTCTSRPITVRFYFLLVSISNMFRRYNFLSLPFDSGSRLDAAALGYTRHDPIVQTNAQVLYRRPNNTRLYLCFFLCCRFFSVSWFHSILNISAWVRKLHALSLHFCSDRLPSLSVRRSCLSSCSNCTYCLLDLHQPSRLLCGRWRWFLRSQICYPIILL